MDFKASHAKQGASLEVTGYVRPFVLPDLDSNVYKTRLSLNDLKSKGNIIVSTFFITLNLQISIVVCWFSMIVACPLRRLGLVYLVGAMFEGVKFGGLWGKVVTRSDRESRGSAFCRRRDNTVEEV